MSRFTNILSAGIMATVAANGAFAQVSTPEIEPNGGKTEATVVLAMMIGDSFTGVSTGNVIGAGNSAVSSADYWEIATAPQPVPGWYRWTLTVSAGNTISVRALDVSGSAGSGSTAIPGTDDEAQSSFNDQIDWYSNESISRICIRVLGSGSSPAAYSVSLTGTPISSTLVTGTFAPGMIQVTTVGQTSDDTDISIADSTRTIIPGYLNDDDGIGNPGLQSELTRMYTPGIYYFVVSDFDQNNSEGGAVDDDYVSSEVMDFPNVYCNSSISIGDNLSFRIDDGQGTAVITSASKTLIHGLEFFEFRVGAGSMATLCNGDGGNQLGCTTCPCGNNTAPGTIGGCINSAGTSALLQVSGDTSVSLPPGSSTDLRFSMSGLPSNAFCILNSGDGLAPGNPANPCFGLNSGIRADVYDGLRCAVMNTRRHGGRAADANGDVGVTTNPWGGEAGPQAGIALAGSGFIAGQTRYFQVINRDNPLAVCGRGLNSSQAAQITFTP